jgi:hypothetical protein
MNLVRHSRQRQQLNSKHLLSVLGSSPEVCVGSSATIEEPSSTILHMADGPSTTAEMVAKGTQPPSVAFAGTSKLLVQPYYGPERTNPGANIETATQYQPERYFNIGNSIPFASLGEPPSYHEYLRQTEEGFCNPPLAPSLTSSKSSFQRFKRSSVLSRTMDDNEVLQPPSTARRFSESSNLSIISSLSQQFSAMSVSFNAR